MFELRKVVKSKFLLIMWIIFIVCLFSLNFLYIFKSVESVRNEKYFPERYDNFTQLKERIDLYEEQIDNNSFETYIDKEDLIEKLDLYKYLYENKIEYRDFRMDNDLDVFENDKIHYLSFVVNSFSLVTFCLIMFLCVNIYNSDFLFKTYKYVYTRKQKRLEIIFKKILVGLLFTIIALTVSLLIFKIIVSKFNLNYSYLITQKTNIFVLETNKYISEVFIYYILDCLFYFILFTSICLISKNYIKNIIICFIIILIFNIFTYYFDVKFINQLITPGATLRMNGFQLKEVITGYIIKYVIAIMMIISSIIFFKKKDLA